MRFKKKKPISLNDESRTNESFNDHSITERITDATMNEVDKVQDLKQSSSNESPQENRENEARMSSLEQHGEFKKIVEKFINSCFDKIKECLNESPNGRLKVSDLVECLKKKGCSSPDGNICIEKLIEAICVNSVGGSFPCFSRPMSKISCSSEDESKECKDCYCETNYLFRVDREYVEIYNPKKHGWWEVRIDGDKCVTRIFKPPACSKDVGGPIPNVSTIQTIQDIQHDYWKDLSLHCYFKWLESLYGNACQDFISTLRGIVQNNHEQLINAAREKDISTFTNVFNSTLEEVSSVSDSFLWRGCSPRRNRISQQLSQDCWNSIFNLCLSASGITPSNYRTDIRKLFPYVNEIVEKCLGCSNTFTSWLLFLSNPKFFMPLCQDSMPDAINSLADLIMTRLQGVRGVKDYRNDSQKCTGAHSDNVGCFLELFVILNYFRLEKGYQDMIPLVCYFFKRKKAESDIITEKAIAMFLNLILYGPPGTGKTYEAKRKAVEIIIGKKPNKVEEIFHKYLKDERIRFVTFHPSFAYENFIEGIRAKVVNGQVNYYIEDGIFKKICIDAMWHALKSRSSRNATYDKKKNDVINGLSRALEEGVDKVFDFDNAEKFVLIIDEINRGNIPSIFGELITLIEENKRLGGSEALFVTLPYSGEQFVVPKNLYIIGTMNTADRSIILLDTALRRRFTFEELMPRPDLVNFKIGRVDIKKLLETINGRIKEKIGRDYQIGHSYFLPLQDNRDLRLLVSIFRNQVLPLLQEYFHGRWEELVQEKILGEKSGEFINKNGDIVLDIYRGDLENLFVSIYSQGAQSNGSQDSN